MKKVSLALLAILFSASMASAETFEVRAFNYGLDANNVETIVKSITRTTTYAKPLPAGITRANVDVRGNEIDNTAIGANASMSVDADLDCIACDGKFYDAVKVEADNAGDVDTQTFTNSSVGMVEDNQINGAAIGANAQGSYTNSVVDGTLTTIDSPAPTTFLVNAINRGMDSDDNKTHVVSRINTFTDSETLSGVAYIGGHVEANVIDNTGIGANASMTVDVDTELEPAGKFYADVDVDSLNFGDVEVYTDTYSTAGNVIDNIINTTAIGANASGSYANINRNP